MKKRKISAREAIKKKQKEILELKNTAVPLICEEYVSRPQMDAWNHR